MYWLPSRRRPSMQNFIAISYILLASIAIDDNCAARTPQKQNESGREKIVRETVLELTSLAYDDHLSRVTDFKFSSNAFENVLKPPPRSGSSQGAAANRPRQDTGRSVDRCWKYRCHIGYVCAIVHGKATCICGQPRDCLHRKRKPVCGSDGHVYINHCELHRVACVRNTRLRVRHPLSVCLQEDEEEEGGEGEGGGRPAHAQTDKTTVDNPAPDEGSRGGHLERRAWASSSTGYEAPSPPPYRSPVARVDVSEGSSLELLCDVLRVDETKWLRNGHVISDVIDNVIEILPNGALYFREVSVFHSGFYTCHDSSSQQEHLLIVNTLPSVTVYPITQFHTPGEDATLQCHAAGIPTPLVSWELNEASLPFDAQGHYRLLNDNHTLTIVRANNIIDTGAYKCIARNTAGISQDIATVFVETVDVPKYTNEPYRVFAVFHLFGYTVFRPSDCRPQVEVSGRQRLLNASSDRLSETGVPTVCGPSGRCFWGGGVNVQNKFIYVSQPQLDRIIVIEIGEKFRPVEVIETDHRPVHLIYFDLYDQVWIVCCTDGEQRCNGNRASVVIRGASEEKVHRQVHTRPIENRYDTISRIFLPTKSDFPLLMKYGYVSHNDEQILYKLDLETLGYVKDIDLGSRNCVPRSLSIIAIGGKVVVNCQPLNPYNRSSSIVLDYVTDVVMTTLEDNFAESFISPDQRLFVAMHANRTLISVFELSETGDFKQRFAANVLKEAGSVVFFPSERSGTRTTDYDIFVSVIDDVSKLIRVNAVNGMTQVVSGIGRASTVDSRNSSSSSSSSSRIVNSGIFGDYLMVASEDYLTVIDAKKGSVQCKCNSTRQANTMVWVEPLRL